MPLDKLILHERDDQQPSPGLVDNIRSSGALRNPPMITPLHDRTGRYMVMDGAHRTLSFQTLGMRHILAQVVEPDDPDLSLHPWNHVLWGLEPDEFYESISSIPFIKLEICRPEDGYQQLISHHALALIHLADREMLAARIPANDQDRGPYRDFEESAYDALVRIKGNSAKLDWSLGPYAHRIEGYNGYGYHVKGITSPYLVGGSNKQKSGKYVADHVFDPDHWDTQLGVLTLLKALMEADPSIRFGSVSVPPKPRPQPDPTPPPLDIEPVDPPKKPGWFGHDLAQDRRGHRHSDRSWRHYMADRLADCGSVLRVRPDCNRGRGRCVLLDLRRRGRAGLAQAEDGIWAMIGILSAIFKFFDPIAKITDKIVDMQIKKADAKTEQRWALGSHFIPSTRLALGRAGRFENLPFAEASIRLLAEC